MSYSRAKPSTDYHALIKLYSNMHRDGVLLRNASGTHKLKSDAVFTGEGVVNMLPQIRHMIKLTDSQTILDYGCGKGGQYRARAVADPSGMRYGCIQEYWNVSHIACYDPAVEAFATLPAQYYDGVIVVNVLERAAAADIPWLTREIFSLARHFVFIAVDCCKSGNILPNGKDEIFTDRSPSWWQGLLTAIAVDFPAVDLMFAYVDAQQRNDVIKQTPEPYFMRDDLFESV
jgi:hypothetical protein